MHNKVIELKIPFYSSGNDQGKSHWRKIEYSFSYYKSNWKKEIWSRKERDRQKGYRKQHYFSVTMKHTCYDYVAVAHRKENRSKIPLVTQCRH